MDIVIDFDGTCVTHAYPKIGADIGAVPVLQELVQQGHRLILSTMRSEDELEQAVEWFKQHEITLFGIQINPEQVEWTSSPKPYGQLYIDDMGLGVPTMFDSAKSPRAFVNWAIVRNQLKGLGIL